MQEFGMAKNCHGPFAEEMDAVRDAREKKAGPFVTGHRPEGWYWATEDDYVQLSENKLKAVN